MLVLLVLVLSFFVVGVDVGAGDAGGVCCGVIVGDVGYVGHVCVIGVTVVTGITGVVGVGVVDVVIIFVDDVC